MALLDIVWCFKSRLSCINIRHVARFISVHQHSCVVHKGIILNFIEKSLHTII